jgi:hypothetical protein
VVVGTVPEMESEPANPVPKLRDGDNGGGNDSRVFWASFGRAQDVSGDGRGNRQGLLDRQWDVAMSFRSRSGARLTKHGWAIAVQTERVRADRATSNKRKTAEN